MIQKRIGFRLLLLIFIALFSSQILYTHDLSLINPKKNWVPFFKNLTTLFQMDTFVESGTYLGDTAALAAQHFPIVHTMELTTKFYKKAVARFTDSPTVFTHHGDSAKILPTLLATLAQNGASSLFWLDGHFMAHMSMPEDDSTTDDYTPILKELNAIKNSGLKKVVLLIDDIRLFGSVVHKNRITLAGDALYPLLKDICDLLQSAGFNYLIMGDILLAYDQSIEISVSPVLHAVTISRLFDETNYTIEDVFAAEALIANAEGEERESLEELYKDFAMPWRTGQDKSPYDFVMPAHVWHNKSPHYNLWYGLMLKKQGHHKEAIKQFQEVIDLGYDHWRVFWYLGESFYKTQNFEAAQQALKIVLTQQPDFYPARALYFID